MTSFTNTITLSVSLTPEIEGQMNIFDIIGAVGEYPPADFMNLPIEEDKNEPDLARFEKEPE